MKKHLWIYVLVAFLVAILLFGRCVEKIRKFNSGIEKYNSLSDICKMLEMYYVDTINDAMLYESAINGMLKSLDPHSYYLPPSDAQSSNDDLNGSFDGIGVQFRMLDDTVNIIMPVAGGPSEKIGIRAGDKIISANDTAISGMKMATNEVMRRLKGKRGSKVKVGIVRYGVDKTLFFDIIRAPIPTYSIDAHFMADNLTGYIKLSKFSSTTTDEMTCALEKLKDNGMKKLILDLRNNGGGILQQAVETADLFLKNGQKIVSIKGRNQDKEYLASDYGLFEGSEMVVLMDEFSASASEIIAGALQDNDAATIVGRRSFGKGLVQSAIPLNNGGEIRLTVARYYTPSGRCIQRPYILGETDPEEDLIKKINDGELFSLNNVHLDSSQVFQTVGGRTVYGGGGIMPDVYVPYQTENYSTFLNKLFNSATLINFAFNYSNQNRNQLKTMYLSGKNYIKNFQVDEKLMNVLADFAKKNGIEFPKTGKMGESDKIKNYLKAYIARDVFGENCFYEIILQEDNDYRQALNNLEFRL
ncbi:MAG: S41 family peptidase [Bacteroidales bacterium]|nr:S41 family peptidase [Bacteroidales bacterium]